jgi:hypothetical protein
MAAADRREKLEVRERRRATMGTMTDRDDDGGQTFTARYQLTRALGRHSLWLWLGEWAPFLVGLALLTLLCAVWPALGMAGKAMAILIPVLVALLLLNGVSSVQRAIETHLGRDIVCLFNEKGVSWDTGLAKSEIPWTTMRRIVRGRSVWVFYIKPGSGSRFLVPVAAIPVEARALVARWASAARVQLT